MNGKVPINTTIIPPATDVSPTIKVEEFEDEFRMSAGYTFDAINAMVRRIEENLDEELMKRLAEQHGYIKPIRCRDCEYAKLVSDPKYIWKASCSMLATATREWIVNPDDHCAWGKRKNQCRNADEETTAKTNASSGVYALEAAQIDDADRAR